MPFGNFDFKKPDLEKVSDVVWDIPISFKEGMRVPARIVATKDIVDQMDLQVYDQITNVATLPGIVNRAYCMADGHSGYGFPIGGVAAFDINDGGVISPGGIGFDVNCLPPEARISVGHGSWKRIADLEKSWDRDRIVFFDVPKRTLGCANSLAFMKRVENRKLVQVVTESGRVLRSTRDHPVLTSRGMTEACRLSKGDIVHTRPFSGVEFEEPDHGLILEPGDIERVLDSVGVTENGNSRRQIARFLQEHGLDNVRYDSPSLPVLIKLMGFIFGDGCISFTKKGKKGLVSFYGKKEDLESIRSDLKELGFKAQKIYSRKRHHRIKTNYGTVEFDFLEESLFKKSTGLAALLVALGTPFGVKTSKEYRVPRWLMKAPLWQKRLFLASFFGAELSSPDTNNGYNFKEPQFNMNKLESLRQNSEDFLNDIRMLLLEFGIRSSYPSEVEGNSYEGKSGNTMCLRVSINGTPENLFNLWEKVGFEYNRQKTDLSALAASYLRFKERARAKRRESRNLAAEMYRSGVLPHNIRSTIRSEHISDSFIDHSIWPDRSDDARVPAGFPKFEEYSGRLAGDGVVYDKIEEVSEVPYSGYVYDFTMNDENHNFIADSFVTSNCGMRLVLTNLTYSDVKPHVKAIIDRLFERIPAGVGGTGFVKLTKGRFRRVLQEGGRWAVENGYGWEEDLQRTELGGMADWADVSKVSEKAIERGYKQIGTLGSGNHYLEIQRVLPENIKDERLAKKWGLFPDQVVIMFHTGSRGEGHQIATDYLQKFLSVMDRKYGIKILDRELACAPFNSPEGQDYWKAMGCAVNFSFANRQTILHRVREVFAEVFKRDADSLGLRQVFDIAHNRATLEKHKVDGQTKELLVHRKGATASYYSGRPEIPEMYRKDGSPVIIGGSMETGSWLLVGGEKAGDTFCSTAHGSGRTMSRAKAIRTFRGEDLQRDMMQRGIYVKSVSFSGLAEEAGGAYKDVDAVIDATHKAGISNKVVKFVPIGNLKG